MSLSWGTGSPGPCPCIGSCYSPTVTQSQRGLFGICDGGSASTLPRILFAPGTVRSQARPLLELPVNLLRCSYLCEGFPTCARSSGPRHPLPTCPAPRGPPECSAALTPAPPVTLWPPRGRAWVFLVFLIPGPAECFVHSGEVSFCFL